MVKKQRHHLDSSSDDDHDFTRRDAASVIHGAAITTSPNARPLNNNDNHNNPTTTPAPQPQVFAPFTLQVPATYANKHPALVDRNGLVSSSLSEKQNPTNSHRVPQQKEETWKRPDLMESRFKGPSAMVEARIFGNPSAAFGDFAPSCSNPRVALPPVQHKFRLATTTSTSTNAKNSANLHQKLTSGGNTTTATDCEHGEQTSRFCKNLIPALVLPQHNAQQLLEKDFQAILEANKNNNNNNTNNNTSRNVSRLSGAKVETARTLPSNYNNGTILNNNLHTMEKEKKLLSQTARSRPPPPPFTSVKIDEATANAALTSYLDDKNAEEKLNALKSSNGKILFRQEQEKQKRQTSSSSPTSSRATSKLSESQQQHQRQTSVASSHASSTGNNSSLQSSSSRRNGNNNRSRKVYASEKSHAHHHHPPNENDYIEDNTEDPSKFSNNQEWTKHALDQFDYQTLPPVIEAARRQKEASGRTALALQMSMSEASFNPAITTGGNRTRASTVWGGNYSNNNLQSALKANALIEDPNTLLAEDASFTIPPEFAKNNTTTNSNYNNNNNNVIKSPLQSHILLVSASNSGSTTEAASARVARTLFHAGLCQNLQIVEKLKAKISPQDLEKRLQTDFLHRRQVSKEDFVAFLSRVLKEEYVSRREADQIWTMLDSSGNGVLETRELRSELVKFVKTGIRDISFNFVAQLLEGRETTACNAFISRFDIQNIVNAIMLFYKDDKDVCDAVRDLPDKFQYNHHLARIPIAVLRDRILGDRKLLSIFQAVALEARKLKLEENAAKGIPFASALGHFAPMSIPQHYSNTNNNNNTTTISMSSAEASMNNSNNATNKKGARSMNNNNNNNNNSDAHDLGNTAGELSDTVLSQTLSDQNNNNNPKKRNKAVPITTNYVPPTTTMMIRSSGATATLNINNNNNSNITQGSNNNNNTASNTNFNGNSNNMHNFSLDLNAVYLVGPGSENFVDRLTGELIGHPQQQQRRVSRQHNLGGGSVRVDSTLLSNSKSEGVSPTTNNNTSSTLSNGIQNMNNHHHHRSVANDNNNINFQSGRSSSLSNVKPNGNNNNANNGNFPSSATNNSQNNNNGKKALRRKPSNISQQLAQFEHNNNTNNNTSIANPFDRSLSSVSNLGVNNGPESSSAAGIVRMLHNPVTNADRYVCQDARKQDDAAETGNPKWYTKANVLYVETSDNRQARPVFQSFN